MSVRDTFKKYAAYLSLGVEIAVGIALPILLGYGLDIWLETYPWLTLAGCVIGMVNVLVLIIRMNKELNKDK